MMDASDRNFMRVPPFLQTVSFAVSLAIAPVMVTVPQSLIQTQAVAQTTRPLAIVVDGGNNWLMQDSLYKKLRDLNAEIWYTSHTTFQDNTSAANLSRTTDSTDTLFLIEGQQILNNIPGDRPILLIGDGAGARSILKLLPLINREIQLVALIDPSTQDPLLYSNASSPSDNVKIFLSYFAVVTALEECRNAIQCQQFTATPQGANSTTWLQNDIAQNIDLALKPSTPTAIAQTPPPNPTPANRPPIQTSSSTSTPTNRPTIQPNANTPPPTNRPPAQTIVFESATPASNSNRIITQSSTPLTPPPSQTLLWQSISGKAKNISVSSDGTVWGVDPDNKIIQWNGNSWTTLTGLELKQIAVGQANDIWGISPQNQVIRWDGKGWTLIGGLNLQHIAAGADGSVWGLDPENKIYRFTNNTWSLIDGQLQQIAVGNAQNVWGVNNANQLFRWNGSGWDFIGDGFKSVSVSAGGLVLAIDTGDRLQRWANPNWQRLNGTFSQMAVGNAQNIWGLKPDGSIYRLQPK